LIKKEDDEVVFAIAEELTNIAPVLGAQHTIVLPILENLCAHDETVIRDRAVKSLTKLIEKYTDNEINNFILPLVSVYLILDHQVGF
jgi:serine/threonine-protein phosphatase 2A regulatory subunit A